VSVTPLQMTMAISAMGNGGVLMEPMLVKEIVSPQGEKITEYPPRPLRRVLSQGTAEQMLSIMATVCQPGGTAPVAKPEGFTAAGKTGTAQKLVGRAYSHNKFNALFIGLVPAEKPVLAMTVIIDEPKGAIYGGVVAAPIFKEIAAQSLRVLGYYPSNEPKKEPESVLAKKDPKKDKPAKASKPEAPKETAPVVAGIIPAAYPALEVKAVSARKEVPMEPLKVMPDLKGFTIRQALDLLHRSGLHCRFEGSGMAVSQDPAPGAAITPGATCLVKFGSSS